MGGYYGNMFICRYGIIWDYNGGHHEYLLYIYTGWWLTYLSEKYEFVSWDDDIPNIWENKKCSKPPTSVYI